jgi:mannose-6-phosphate isomerase-like protein (cupin superfamily)
VILMKFSKRKISAVVACACAATAGCFTVPVRAAEGPAGSLGTGLTAGYHFTKTTDLPLRPIDLSPFQGKFSTEILAAPSTGLQAEIVMYTRLAPGAGKRGLYTLPTDHTYLVMKGKMNVQLGTDEFVVEPNTLILVHPGIPAQVWNSGTEEADALEVVAPIASSDLAFLMRPATATKVDNAAQYIFLAPDLGPMKGGVGHEGLNERVMASTDNGSMNILERLDDVLPGGGGPPTHKHEEDQLYLVTAGVMTVEYKGQKMPASPNTLVVLPRGVLHANTNTGDAVESHVTLLMPAQPGGGPRGIAAVSLADKLAGKAPAKP